jgi:hypothetical protein
VHGDGLHMQPAATYTFLCTGHALVPAATLHAHRNRPSVPPHRIQTVSGPPPRPLRPPRMLMTDLKSDCGATSGISLVPNTTQVTAVLRVQLY